jgi:hypothetical protein
LRLVFADRVEGGGGCIGKCGGIALVDHCYVVIEDNTNDPPHKQWLARLDIGAVLFVFVVSVCWPARSSVVTKDPPHKQGLVRLGLGHC